jgi:aminoglycoside phosphotransferase (APT) family kinase protein
VGLRTRHGGECWFRIVRKTIEPLTGGRHAALAGHPRHWAYWPRESHAYRSGLLPVGPGLRAPRCFGVVGSQVFLEEVDGTPPSVRQAAEHLAAWQVDYDRSLEQWWLARHQLGRRLAVTELDWAGLDADPRLVDLWRHRYQLHERLEQLPLVLSHGDYSMGNLVAQGTDTVALDWATLGWEPVGFDLAHLALSTGEDPTAAYMAATPLGHPADAVNLGFQTALVIIGASRLHWMLSQGLDVPSWYVQFVCERDPR